MEDLSRYLEQQHARDVSRAGGNSRSALTPRSAEGRGRFTDPSLAYLPLDSLVAELLERIRSALQGEAAAAMLLSEDGATLEGRASAGCRLWEEEPYAIPADTGIVGCVAVTGRTLLTGDPRGHGGMPRGWARIGSSFAGAPIVLEGRVLGVLCVLSRRPHPFEPEDRHLLEAAADRVGSALDRVRLRESVRRERDRFGTMTGELAATIEEERRRVSRELHDEIGQLLTVLRLRLQSGANGRAVDEILDDLFARVRDISTSLRPPMLEDLGLGATLSWHCDRFSDQTGIRIDLMTGGLRRRYPPKVELTVFRIVQEALTNVARHARVREARVAVRGGRHTVQALIRDRGVGFAPRILAPTSSRGLSGMLERVSSVGGRVRVVSSPGRGTRISLLVSIPREATPSLEEVL